MQMYEYLYWVCFAVICGYMLLDRKSMSVWAKFVLYIPLLLLLAFTMAITVEQFDIGTYRGIYERMVNSPGTYRIDMFPEWGYQYLNYLAHVKLEWTFERFRFVYAVVVLVIVFFAASRLTRLQGLFFLLYYPKYFLIGLISHTRSGFVNPFIFFAVDWVSKGQYGRVLITSMALTLIHFSAILLNVISVLRFIKLRMIYIVGVVPFAIIFSKVLLPGFIEVASVIDIRQLNYLVSGEDEQRGMFGIEFLRRVALVGVCAYIFYYGKIKDETESLVIKIFILSIFVYIGFHEAKFVSDRVGGMLGFVEPMMWIIFMQNHVMPHNKVLAYALVFAYAALDIGMRAFFLDSLPGHPSIEFFLGVL